MPVTLTPGQQQCMEDRGGAVSAIGAPESWTPGWQPAPTWAEFRDLVERAISCSPYDASQVASMRAGVARTEACYPCAGQQITMSGPCGPPDPASIANDLAKGIDPNPPLWAHCGPPKPLSYYQAIAKPYTDALAQQGLTPLTLGTAGTPGGSMLWTAPSEVPVQPGVQIGPGGVLVEIPTASPNTPGGGSGGSLPPTPGGVSVPASPAASAPGPVTGVINAIFGHPLIAAGFALAIWFLFFRGKR